MSLHNRSLSTDWQLGKSVLQCNQHMFQSKMAADVCFHVGPEEDGQEEVWAHKYVLISRSPVFEAMLDPAWNQEKSASLRVEVPDILPDVFSEMLR